MTELSIIIPTFNECQNIPIMVERLQVVLSGLNWEVIFVDDDSPDGTSDKVREIARNNPRVRCIQRIGRRGLSTAVIEGVLSSSTPVFAVIDGDLQHDEKILPSMYSKIKEEQVDVVIGSRFVDGGGLGNWDKDRVAMSAFATKVSRLITSASLSDPMSGFFMVTREAFDGSLRNLSGAGFKILLDIFASSRKPLEFAELPYVFSLRQHGESKLDTMVLWEYLMLILDKTIGKVIPVRFALFAFVGSTGVIIHYIMLYSTMNFAIPAFNTLTTKVDFSFINISDNNLFMYSQLVATIVAMTSNYFMNNLFTYRDMRLKGIKLFWGLLSFYAVCSLGAIANVGFANYVFKQEYTWQLAAFAGIILGTVWNYLATSIFTWGKSK